MLTPSRPFRFLCALSLSCALHGLIVQALGVDGGAVTQERAGAVTSLSISMIAPSNGTEKTPPAKSVSSMPLPAASPVTGTSPFLSMSPAGAPVIDLTSPAEPYYFKTNELSEKPGVVQDLPADFALLLSGQGFQSAIVRLRINEAGEIDDVLFDASSFSEGNQRLVREAISGMRFTPGKLDALAVKSELRIEIALDGGTP
jgi:hypothetical protein